MQPLSFFFLFNSKKMRNFGRIIKQRKYIKIHDEFTIKINKLYQKNKSYQKISKITGLPEHKIRKLLKKWHFYPL